MYIVEVNVKLLLQKWDSSYRGEPEVCNNLIEISAQCIDKLLEYTETLKNIFSINIELQIKNVFFK